ncbi:hypothetical protein T492DRAFT_475024 [Pavlovales sp. CCMP2436]|nr:hypothetical protein T492DRAFT_475024 [Pavlovales sp. CCMP2436]
MTAVLRGDGGGLGERRSFSISCNLDSEYINATLASALKRGIVLLAAASELQPASNGSNGNAAFGCVRGQALAQRGAGKKVAIRGLPRRASCPSQLVRASLPRAACCCDGGHPPQPLLTRAPARTCYGRATPTPIRASSRTRCPSAHPSAGLE